MLHMVPLLSFQNDHDTFLFSFRKNFMNVQIAILMYSEIGKGKREPF